MKSELTRDAVALEYDARHFAEWCHKYQEYRPDVPYMYHIDSVVNELGDLPFTSTARLVAYLHDTMEDCPGVTHALLAGRFGFVIAESCLALCRGHDETYDEYIRRVCNNPLAARVKCADLRCNLRELDNPDCEPEKLSLRGRYEWALNEITEKWINADWMARWAV
jgi:(p)ppGpp synthase/HD superfamily hydrolase